MSTAEIGTVNLGNANSILVAAPVGVVFRSLCGHFTLEGGWMFVI